MKAELISKRLRFSLFHDRRIVALQLILGLLFLASPTHPASAARMRWEGTLQLDLANYPTVALAGSGVATTSSSGGGTRLESLRIAGGITGVGTIPFTDPDTSATIRSLRISPRLGTGTLGPFWPIAPWPDPQLSRDTLPLRGDLRICLLFPDCQMGRKIPLSQHSGARAVGVGGTLTDGAFGTLRISIEAAPWTVYSTTLRVRTAQGGTVASTRSGWIHGPYSSSSSAAATSGALQLVTPLVVRSNAGMYLPGFTSFTLRFLPEPGFLLLIMAGVVGLLVLGASRGNKERPLDR